MPQIATGNITAPVITIGETAADRGRGPLSRAQARLVLGCMLGLAAGFSGLYFSTLTIFLKPLATEFGWSRAETSAALIMAMLGLAIGAPLQGRLIDRLGALPIIAGSVVCQAAGLAILSFIPANHWLFGLNCLLIGFAGVATGPNGYLSLLPGWFDRRLGLALSCAMVGVGIGAAVFPSQAQHVVMSFGWRAGYRVVAAIALVGGVIAVLMARVGPGPLITTGRAGHDGVAEGLSFSEGVRDWRLVLIALALGLGGAAGLGTALHLAPMLDDRGFSPGQVALAVSVSGVGVIVGRFFGGALMDVIPARLVAASTFVIGAGAMAVLGLNLTGVFPVIVAGAFFLGASLGTEGDFAAFAVRRYLGVRAFSALFGIVYMTYSIGSVIGAILCGQAFDRYGNYVAASTGCVIAMLTAGALASLLGPYRYAAGHGG